MKFTKKFAAVAVAALALVGTTACANSKSNDSSSSKSADIPTKITKKTTVVFWHGMTGTQEKTLQSLTKDFEKRILTLLLSLKTKVSIMTYKQRLTQLCNHQITCLQLLKLILAGF